MQVVLLQLPRQGFGYSPAASLPNIPVAGAYLQAAAQADRALRSVGMVRVTRPIANRAGDALLLRAVEALQPDVVAFTVYLWNEARTLWLARELRRRQPEVGLFAGGPHAGQLLRLGSATDALDWIGVGPGERIFVEKLHSLDGDGSWREERRRRHGPLVTHALPEDTGLARPIYATGILAAEDHQGIAWLETTRGCRFRCAYCQEPQRGGRREVPLPAETVVSDLEALANLGIMDVYLVDAAVNTSPLLAVLDAVLGGRRDKPSLSGAVRPELVDAEAAERLARIGMVEAEVGVQAVDPQVLSNIRRPARLSRVRDGIARLRENGIRVSADCILGLPGDTEATVQQTIELVTDREVVDRGRFFTLSVLPDTHLRRRAEEFALAHQTYPPYLVTGTRELPFDALRSLYGGVLPAARPGRGMLPNPYTLVQPPTEGRDPGEAGAGLPVTHVTCGLDGSSNRTSMRAAVGQVAEELAFEVHVWLSATDVRARLDEARELLDRLSRPNPFGIWHVVLKTRTTPDIAVAEALLRAIHYPTPNWVDAGSLYSFAQTEPTFQRHAAVVYWLDRVGPDSRDGGFVHHHVPQAGHIVHVGLVAGTADEVTETLGRMRAAPYAALLVDGEATEASPAQLRRLFYTARGVQPETPVLFADWAAQWYWHQHVLKGGTLCGVSADWFRNCVRLSGGKVTRTLTDADALSLEGYAMARRLQEG